MVSRCLLVACLGALAVSSLAGMVNLTSVDAATSASWVQLFENRLLTRADAQALSLSGIRGVLEALAPQIKAQPGYTGIFIANCSLYVNTILERVSCNISSPEAAVLSVAPLLTNQTRLPWDYAYEITRSHIVLVNAWVDWTGRLALYDEDYAIAAYPRIATCSASITHTETNPSLTEAPSASLTQSHRVSESLSPSRSPSLSPSVSGTRTLEPILTRTESDDGSMSDTNSRSQILSASPSLSPSVSGTRTLEPTLTRTESDDGSMSDTNSRSQTLSASPSPEPSRSSTQTGSCAKTLSSSSSLSLSPNLSWTESATPSEDPSSSVTLYNGLFAAWHRSTGVYADGTSQPTRYSTSNGVVTDALTGLQWQLSPSASVMSWGNGVSSCAAASTGGYSDWRLPNNVELLTLVDYTIASTGSTPGINAVFSGTPLNYFYTSTPLVGSASKNPWWVSFGQNACYSGFLESLEYNPSCTPAVASQGYVRCVRSPSEAPLPLNRYTIESGAALGTVTDQVTGLIWQKVAPTSGGPNGNGLYTQSQAIAYCSSLNLGGSGAGTWRLPTNRELQTLVDYSKAYGSLMMDTTVFSGEPASGFWSSLVESASREWGVHFGVGLVYTSYFTNTYFVRCVR